jgi:hypothetical protein
MVTRLPENDSRPLPRVSFNARPEAPAWLRDSGQIVRIQSAGASGWALNEAPPRGHATEAPAPTGSGVVFGQGLFIW